MPPDAGALLWDARRAAEFILDFVAGKTWQDYRSDPMLRSAVERQFQIITVLTGRRAVLAESDRSSGEPPEGPASYRMEFMRQEAYAGRDRGEQRDCHKHQ